MNFRMSLNLAGDYQKLIDSLSPAELEVLLKEIEFEINDTLALTFKESQAQVPVDTGRLRLSGKLNKAQRDAMGLEGNITYGTDYALYQHEIPMNHDGEGEKDHYLSDPLYAQADFFAKAIRKILETYFGEG